VGEDTYRIVEADGERGPTVIASAAGRVEAVEAALTGLLAISSPEEGRADASTATLLRAEGPDLAAVVQALAAQLADEAAESGAMPVSVRIDGLLRTDEGFTAWGYAYVPPGSDNAIVIPEICKVTVVEEGGQTTIRLTLVDANSELNQ
jgi:hypothetical protein